MNLTPAIISHLLKPRDPFSHKGTYGHALLVCGSYGKIGAAVLSAGACLRSGVGLLTVHTPECGYGILQNVVAEAMVAADSNDRIITDLINTENYNAIGVGPGIGTHEKTQAALHHLIRHNTKPMVLDADALNILGMNKEWLRGLPPQSILTPHPKEFERMTGESADQEQRVQKQVAFSKQYRVFVVVKGHQSSITTPAGDIFYNTTGNPGMATGGSGDVLTGVITALLAQGFEPLHACQAGVCIHGLAGDLAKEKLGETGMIAGDIRDQLPHAFKRLMPVTN